MVQVQVKVSHLAIDVDGDGISIIYNRGDVFDCPVDRAARLGNSVTILDIPAMIPEPEPNPPDLEIFKPVTKKPTTSARRNRK